MTPKAVRRALLPASCVRPAHLLLAAFIANSTDPHATHDAWLDDVSSKSTIRAARRAKEQRDAAIAARDAADRAKSRPDCLKELVSSGLLTKAKNETVMGALKRLGDHKKRLTQAKAKANKRKPTTTKSALTSSGMDVDPSTNAVDAAAAPSSEIDRVSEQIDQLTSLASILLDVYNETDIYEQTYDTVVKTLRLEGEVPRVCSMILL